MKKVAIIISPNWKDYAEKYLDECLATVRAQDYQDEMKIFLIDNETSEKSYAYLKERANGAEIIRNQNNAGFAEGCNSAIRPAMEQGFEYIFLLNMDTAVASDCLSELVKVVESDQNIGAVQARLMLYSDKSRINSLGNETHFLGFGYCRGYGDVMDKYPELSLEKMSNGKTNSNIFYPSGAAVLFRSSVLMSVGLFDEEYWMYNEDQELGWRMWLAGFKSVLAARAVVYHKYEFAKSIKQYYWMDRNRLITIFKYYHILTLLLIFPALLIMELGLLLFAFQSGWFPEKKKVYQYFFQRKTWRYILAERRKVQALRKVKDGDIVKMIKGTIWYQEIGDTKLKLANPVLNAYWEIVKFLIIW